MHTARTERNLFRLNTMVQEIKKITGCDDQYYDFELLTGRLLGKALNIYDYIANGELFPIAEDDAKFEEFYKGFKKIMKRYRFYYGPVYRNLQIAE